MIVMMIDDNEENIKDDDIEGDEVHDNILRIRMRIMRRMKWKIINLRIILRRKRIMI